MKKSKRAVCTIIILLISTLITGCVSPTPSTMKLVDYKQDAYVNTGQSAAYYDGRVYFVAKNDPKADLYKISLYSMKNDGSDVRFEAKVSATTRLIVTKDAFYYVGIYGYSDGFAPSALYKIKRDVAPNHILLYRCENDNGSVEDSFLLNNGKIIVKEIQPMPSPPGFRYKTIELGKSERILKGFKHFSKLNNQTHEIAYTGYNFDLLEFDGYIITVNPQNIEYKNGKEDIVINDNLNTEYSSCFIDTVENKYIHGETYKAWNALKPLYFSNGELFCAFETSIFILDAKTFEIKRVISFDGYDDFEYYADNAKYLFSDSSEYVLFSERDRNPRLFCIDKDYSTKEIAEINDPSIKVINISDNKILYVDGKKVIYKNISPQGLGNVITEVKTSRMLHRGTVLEVAGDWLFVYKGITENNLIYRINYKTGEKLKIK